MGIIYLVRHGKTKLNKGGPASPERIRGWDDIPLDEKGKQEAHDLGQWFADKDISQVISSDLQRASDVADEISEHSGAPEKLTKNLRPWNLGKLQGKELDKNVIQEMDKAVKSPYRAIDGGEPFQTFLDRFLKFFQTIVRYVEKTDKNIVLVAHFRNLKASKGWLEKGMPDDFTINNKTMSETDLKPADMYLYIYKNDKWKICKEAFDGPHVCGEK